MTINNFRAIGKMIPFNNQGDFYLLEIIARKKDNPTLNKSSNVIKTYFIKSINDLYSKESEIRSLCSSKNVRAYIRLNVRNDKDIALKTSILIAKYIANGDYEAVENVYLKTVGRNNSAEFKKWIVDIDDKSIDVDMILDIIGTLQAEIRTKPYSIHSTLRTKSGYHIITNPFNTKSFYDTLSKYGNIDTSKIELHKDNGALLYFEDNIKKDKPSSRIVSTLVNDDITEIDVGSTDEINEVFSREGLRAQIERTPNGFHWATVGDTTLMREESQEEDQEGDQ